MWQRNQRFKLVNPSVGKCIRLSLPLLHHSGCLLSRHAVCSTHRGQEREANHACEMFKGAGHIAFIGRLLTRRPRGICPTQSLSSIFAPYTIPHDAPTTLSQLTFSMCFSVVMRPIIIPSYCDPILLPLTSRYWALVARDLSNAARLLPFNVYGPALFRHVVEWKPQSFGTRTIDARPTDSQSRT